MQATVGKLPCNVIDFDCRIISLRFIHCGNRLWADRRTFVRLCLVVEPTSRWFSSRHLVTIKKPPKREVFFIGSDCRIRTNDQSVNSRLLYRWAKSEYFGGRYRNWTDIEGFAILCISHSANRPYSFADQSRSTKIIYTYFFINVNIFFWYFIFFFISCVKNCFLLIIFSC